MGLKDITRRRLVNQHLAAAEFTLPEEVVKHLLAMQAQDYNGALWSIGLRTKDCTKASVEQAIQDRKIVRTWPMRGTLHVLHADDVKWMVKLLAPRATRAAAGRRRGLGLDEATMDRAKTALVTALEGGSCLSRQQLCSILDQLGIATAGQRGIHILRHYCEQALLCFGPHAGKEPTFVLLDEWLPEAADKTREEALAELATRYYAGHGPATLQDLAGWGFMTMTDAKLAVELAGDKLESLEVDGQRYHDAPAPAPAKSAKSAILLPGFDEYILGYKNRSAMLDQEHGNRIVPGNNGMFLPTIIDTDGRVVGTWKRLPRKSFELSPSFFTDKPLEIKTAADRYRRFLEADS